MSPITTHVLDTAKGKPATNLAVKLERLKDMQKWETLTEKSTNADGRIPDLMGDHQLEAGTYRLTFNTGAYHKGTGFYPTVAIEFCITHAKEHYHVPLLLSPFGYSTYRGS